MFTNEKREGINTFVCAITHNAYRHCRVRFCWTTFLETAVCLRLPAVHTTQNEFENGGFTLQMHQMFSFHTAAEEIKNATITDNFVFVSHWKTTPARKNTRLL